MATQTAKNIDPQYPLLVGKLTVGVMPSREPGLYINVWCPYCRAHHYHGWGVDPLSTRAVEHREAHCHDTPKSQAHEKPFSGKGYYIGLDPERADENKATIAEYRASHAAWVARQEVRGTKDEPAT